MIGSVTLGNNGLPSSGDGSQPGCFDDLDGTRLTVCCMG